MSFFFLELLCLAWLAAVGDMSKISQEIYSLEESFFMTEDLRQMFSGLIIDTSKDLSYPYYGSRDETLNTNVTSTCPWAHRVVFNPNRIPMSHVEAVCLSHMCLNVSQDQNSAKALDNQNFQPKTLCSKVEYAKWVMVKQAKKHGTFKLKRRLLLINVGCTCTHQMNRRITS